MKNMNLYLRKSWTLTLHKVSSAHSFLQERLASFSSSIQYPSI
jgi:hypothetical protein